MIRPLPVAKAGFRIVQCIVPIDTLILPGVVPSNLYWYHGRLGKVSFGQCFQCLIRPLSVAKAGFRTVQCTVPIGTLIPPGAIPSDQNLASQMKTDWTIACGEGQVPSYCVVHSSNQYNTLPGGIVQSETAVFRIVSNCSLLLYRIFIIFLEFCLFMQCLRLLSWLETND